MEFSREQGERNPNSPREEIAEQGKPEEDANNVPRMGKVNGQEWALLEKRGCKSFFLPMLTGSGKLPSATAAGQPVAGDTIQESQICNSCGVKKMQFLLVVDVWVAAIAAQIVGRKTGTTIDLSARQCSHIGSGIALEA